MAVLTETSAHTLIEPILAELHEEAAITKRVLQRVPADKLAWRPHAKSMSLGQLAQHVATIPGGLARLVSQDSFDVTQGNFNPPQPASLDEILAAHEQSIRDAEQLLQGMSDQQATAGWRLLRNGAEVFTRRRIEVLRSIMLNHWYHHRGQLSVYLRLLDIPVPVIYGRSADENPFA
ncbi:MAG TPA: DinB family protein [Candidatus Sulfotelmatobacter sp.]|nr:DinB family protein [Candidatus Sulfotelmatobacter sp.]